MSTYTMPAHQTVSFTCDARPGARGCVAGESVRLDQTALLIVTSAVMPEGWTRRGDADLCPQHRNVERVNSLIWHTSTDRPTSMERAS